MSAQHVTPDLRRWILTQISEGHGVELILQAMRASGWNEAVAMAAYQHTVNEARVGASALSADVVRNAVPEPRLPIGAHEVDVAGHKVHVVSSLHEPRVIVFGGVEQRGHVGACAGDQDGDFDFSHAQHCQNPSC